MPWEESWHLWMGSAYLLCSVASGCVQPQKALSKGFMWGKRDSSGYVFPQIPLSEETMLVSIVSPDRENYWSHIGFWRSKEVRDWQAFRGSGGLASSTENCYSARHFLISWLSEACVLGVFYPYLVSFQNEGLTVVRLQKHLHWSMFLLIIWTGLKLILMVTFFYGSNNQSFSELLNSHLSVMLYFALFKPQVVASSCY